MSKSVKSKRPQIIDAITERFKVPAIARLKNIPGRAAHYECFVVFPESNPGKRMAAIRTFLENCDVFNSELLGLGGHWAIKWVQGVKSAQTVMA